MNNASKTPLTARAATVFDVGSFTYDKYFPLVRGMAKVKQACAMTNGTIAALSPAKAKAIADTCARIAEGELQGLFPVNVFPGSFGVFNMIFNEVVAAQTDVEVTPGDVNMCQAAEDTVLTARTLALYDTIGTLLEAIPVLESELAEKAGSLQAVVKMGRTSFRDSVPITFGQVFSGYLSQIQRQKARLEEERKQWESVALGGTAIGTGLGTFPGYGERVCENLSAICGRPITQAQNIFDEFQSADKYVYLHAAIQALAICCGKIAADFRVMASGPRAGIREITLVPLQPGSSIMPGKMNPTVPHMVMQISQRVSANHAGLALAASSGELDLGPASTLLFKSVMDSAELVSKGIKIFGTKVVRGMKINEEHCKETAERSLALATAAKTALGEEAASMLQREAVDKKCTCAEAAVSAGLMSERQAQGFFDVFALTQLSRSAELLAKTQRQRSV